MRASTTAVGMTQISTADNVTDTNACALSATEKNANIGGSMANKLLTTYNTAKRLENVINNRGSYYYKSGTNVTISIAYYNILLAGLTGLIPGLYWVLGHVYCNDADIYTQTIIKINGKVSRWITNSRHDGVYETTKQLGAFIRVNATSDIIQLFFEVNYVNSGKYANGALEAIMIH